MSTKNGNVIEFEDEKASVNIRFSDENAQLHKLIETMAANLKKLD